VALCQGTPRQACPSGQTFVCEPNGNSYCMTPQASVDKTATQKAYTLPNGAVVDTNGNVLQAAPQDSQPQQTYTSPQQPQGYVQLNEVTSNYKAKIAAINQQILDVNTKYYSDLNNLERGGSSGETMGFLIGEENQLLDTANQTISQLQLQEQQLYLNYQNQLNSI
jgi:hypothetical protein